VELRYFPTLTFKLDSSLDEFIRIQEILGQLEQERLSRSEPTHDGEQTELG
jgi:ribosome-binding factor A